MRHILSLGAGVQSSTLALMAAKGEIDPMPELAVFADTQAEPKSVYKWLDWLEGQLPYPVLRVTGGNLEADAVQIRISKKTQQAYLRQDIPAHTQEENGDKGILWRQCTARYKIDPIYRSLKHLKSDGVVMWMGISTDEAQRMKDSLKQWVVNRYPLIEKRMSRADCFEWMNKNGYPMPPRSSCVFCPYHSDKEWMRLRDEEPEEFKRAIEFERNLQQAASEVPRIRSQYFLHNSRRNLDEVIFRDDYQPNLFNNECEGMCGV